jgi:hypothetical protein
MLLALRGTQGLVSGLENSIVAHPLWQRPGKPPRKSQIFQATTLFDLHGSAGLGYEITAA